MYVGDIVCRINDCFSCAVYVLQTPAMKRSKMISGSPSLVTKGTRSRSVPKSTESEKVAVDTSANSTGRGIRMYVTEGPVTLFAVRLYGTVAAA